jgi:hypothetical protein
MQGSTNTKIEHFIGYSKKQLKKIIKSNNPNLATTTQQLGYEKKNPRKKK